MGYGGGGGFHGKMRAYSGVGFVKVRLIALLGIFLLSGSGNCRLNVFFVFSSLSFFSLLIFLLLVLVPIFFVLVFALFFSLFCAPFFLVVWLRVLFSLLLVRFFYRLHSARRKGPLSLLSRRLLLASRLRIDSMSCRFVLYYNTTGFLVGSRKMAQAGLIYLFSGERRILH